MNTPLALSLDQVSFSYEKTKILENVNISISKGEFVGIFGPNGGGKTTLLKLVMGFLSPLQGTILVQGTPPAEARSRIGYVPQVSKVDRQFPITAEEVVQLGCLSKVKWWGSLPKHYKQRALEALEKVGMIAHKDTPFGKLSGGQAQRVLIARALASEDMEILLLDEPTASVDPAAEEEILSILFSLKGSITVLMVTHDLQTILQKTEKLLCVHREVHLFSPTDVCEHFGLGLYHRPLIIKNKS